MPLHTAHGELHGVNSRPTCECWHRTIHNTFYCARAFDASNQWSMLDTDKWSSDECEERMLTVG